RCLLIGKKQKCDSRPNTYNTCAKEQQNDSEARCHINWQPLEIPRYVSERQVQLLQRLLLPVQAPTHIHKNGITVLLLTVLQQAPGLDCDSDWHTESPVPLNRPDQEAFRSVLPHIQQWFSLRITHAELQPYQAAVFPMLKRHGYFFRSLLPFCSR